MSTALSPGCVVFLMDESAGMKVVLGDVVAGGKRAEKSNAQRVATALNALLNQLTRGPDFDVALIGYQSDAADEVNVGSRWSGALVGRDFVSTAELAASPLRVETRSRKVPVPGSVGMTSEEPVDFPVWYEAELGAKAPQVAAYHCCRDLLSSWLADCGPEPGAPLVVHVSAGASADGNPQKAVDELMKLETPAGPILLFQAHLASSAEAVPSLYPSSHVYLTVGSARDLFRRASPLPPHLMAALKAVKVPANPNARGMIYSAKGLDVIRLFGLVTAHTKDWPSKGAVLAPEPAAPVEAGAPEAEVTDVPPAEPPAVPEEPPAVPEEPPAVPEVDTAAAAEEPVAAEPEEAAAVPTEAPAMPALTEKAGFVVLVLDRSVEDPFGGNLKNACTRLQDHANELLTQMSVLENGTVEVGIVSWGLDADEQVDVRTGFEGPLEGRTTVSHTELADGAVRVDEFEEEMSNGMGGLITVRRKKPIYMDLEPTSAAPSGLALATVASMLNDWCRQHTDACLPPIVLHLTRGRAEPAEMEAAARQVLSVSSAAGPVLLYHLVVTESPHKSLAYPDSADEIDEPGLKKLWELSSPLLGRERLAEEKPAVKAESRGMVINGKFDLLLDEVERVLAP